MQSNNRSSRRALLSRDFVIESFLPMPAQMTANDGTPLKMIDGPDPDVDEMDEDDAAAMAFYRVRFRDTAGIGRAWRHCNTIRQTT